MSEPSEKLDMKSLNEALEVNAETGNPNEVRGAEEHARETMNKSNTLNATASPATLSPGSPSRSPVVGATSLPVAESTAAPPVDQVDNTPMNPTVQQIKSMFPDLDTDTIQAVVVAEGGDFERAINMLLQMSDPTYVPPPPLHRTSQTEQDEHLARSLAADEQHQARYQVPPSGRGGALGSFFGMGGGQEQPASSPSYDPNNLAYKPRVRRTASGQAPAVSTVPQQSVPHPAQSVGQSFQADSTAAWPGPKEAKQWQEDINKLAETGFARAASTFSALRQKSEQAWAARTQPTDGQADAYSGNGGVSSAGRGGAASGGGRGGSLFGGWSQRVAGDRSGQNSVSPTIGSSRGFDRDPSPVGDHELAKILARGRSGSGSDGYQIDSVADTQRKASLSSIKDRYKKVAQTQRAGKGGSGGKDEADYDGGLSWDDAGRTGDKDEMKPFEPIKISDNSTGSSADVKQATSPSAQPRNAVSLMESSGGRGLTSSASAGPPTIKQGEQRDAHNDAEDDDDDDLEYVANPFEDED